jgi:hypothetical protein
MGELSNRIAAINSAGQDALAKIGITIPEEQLTTAKIIQEIENIGEQENFSVTSRLLWESEAKKEATGITANGVDFTWKCASVFYDVIDGNDIDENNSQISTSIDNIKNGFYKILINDDSYDALCFISENVITFLFNNTILMIAVSSNGQKDEIWLYLDPDTFETGNSFNIKVLETSHMEDTIFYFHCPEDSHGNFTHITPYVYLTKHFTNPTDINRYIPAEILVEGTKVSFSYYCETMEIGTIILGQGASFESEDNIFENSFKNSFLNKKPIVIKLRQPQEDGVIVIKEIHGILKKVDGKNFYYLGNQKLFPFIPG